MWCTFFSKILHYFFKLCFLILNKTQRTIHPTDSGGCSKPSLPPRTNVQRPLRCLTFTSQRPFGVLSINLHKTPNIMHPVQHVILPPLPQGGQRFNLYGPVLMAQGFVDPWYRRVYGSDDDVWRNGLQCCSSETVTFHYVTPAETYVIHHMMHNKEK